jgi:hypothetical protein
MTAGSCLCGWNKLGQLHAQHQAEALDAVGLLQDPPPAEDDDDDSVEDDAYPVGPRFMWIIYQECPTCGAEAKQPCVGMTYGPHEGRLAHWQRPDWEPSAGSGSTVADLPLNDWVGQALGSASACWTNLAGAGEFDSTRAGWVYDGLMKHLNAVIDAVAASAREAAEPGPAERALLGLATTREMLEEIEVRAAVGRLDAAWSRHARALLRLEQIASGLRAGLPGEVLDYRTAGS